MGKTSRIRVQTLFFELVGKEEELKSSQQQLEMFKVTTERMKKELEDDLKEVGKELELLSSKLGEQLKKTTAQDLFDLVVSPTFNDFLGGNPKFRKTFCQVVKKCVDPQVLHEFVEILEREKKERQDSVLGFVACLLKMEQSTTKHGRGVD